MKLIHLMRLMLFFVLLAANLSGQPELIAAGDDSSVANLEQVDQQLTPDQQERRKQLLSASWIMLIGVAILGGILLLIVFLFGNRLRRILRKPLPDAPLRDPMWYLKKKASDTSELTDEAADTDHE